MGVQGRAADPPAPPPPSLLPATAGGAVRRAPASDPGAPPSRRASQPSPCVPWIEPLFRPPCPKPAFKLLEQSPEQALAAAKPTGGSGQITAAGPAQSPLPASPAQWCPIGRAGAFSPSHSNPRKTPPARRRAGAARAAAAAGASQPGVGRGCGVNHRAEEGREYVRVGIMLVRASVGGSRGGGPRAQFAPPPGWGRQIGGRAKIKHARRVPVARFVSLPGAWAR
jgi:hypothetical protein